MHFDPELEICAETLQACEAACSGGAHRIEICASLAQGGLTPSHALIRAAIRSGRGLPVHVLLRPRPGNFIYSDAEFQIMCDDLEHAAVLGASGFVLGILTPQRTVDQRRTAQLVRLARDKQVTFHRAFDHTHNLSEALEQVIDTGCGRLLTSGGRATVREGMPTIAAITEQAAGRIRVAAGGSLTPEIASELRRLANIDLHASLRNTVGRGPRRSSDPLWDSENGAEKVSVADVEAMASTLSVQEKGG